jgi:tetratricopeptide (TPR) repeat protein
VAVEEFKSALAVDPDHLAHNVNLHLGLCKVLVRLGRGKDALNSCSEALKIDEELIDALVQVLNNFKHHCACLSFTSIFLGHGLLAIFFFIYRSVIGVGYKNVIIITTRD